MKGLIWFISLYLLQKKIFFFFLWVCVLSKVIKSMFVTHKECIWRLLFSVVLGKVVGFVFSFYYSSFLFLLYFLITVSINEYYTIHFYVTYFNVYHTKIKTLIVERESHFLLFLVAGFNLKFINIYVFELIKDVSCVFFVMFLCWRFLSGF